MRAKTVLVLAVVAAALALAVPPITEPAAQQQNPWFEQDCSGPDETRLGPYGNVTRLQTEAADQSLVSGTPGERMQRDRGLGLAPFPDWGWDRLVGNLVDDPTFGRLSTDEAPNGDLWAGILDPDDGPDNDSVFVYRSTDGGYNWTFEYHLSSVSNHDIRDYCLRVGSDANGIWVYDFVAYGGTGLYVRRRRPDGGGSSWIQIQPGDTFAGIGADRNIEDPQHLFILYETTGGKIKRMSSSDSAETWGNFGNVHTGGAGPTCHAGGDGYVYLGFHHSDSSIIWLGRYTNNMISPGYTWSQLDTTNNLGCWNVSVAGARTSPGASQTAVAMWSRENNNNNIPPYYAYTTNGGVGWTFSFWPVTNQARSTWDARYPYIRNSYVDPSELFRAVVTMHEPTTSWDTVVYAWTRPTDPTTWEGRDTPNNHRQTGEFGAKVDRSDELQGGYIVYRHYAETEVYADGWNFPSGLAEGEEPTPGERNVVRVATLLGRDAGISLSLARSARVTARLRDGTGRVIQHVHDGFLDSGRHRLPIDTRKLSAGIYFLELELDGERQTAKLIRLQ